MTLEKFKARSVEFLKITWIPLLFLFAAGILLLKFSILPKQETSKIFLGVIFGVFVGLVLDVFKRSYDDFRNKIKLENISLELLKTDAVKLYKCFFAYENLLNKGKINLDATLPPKLELKNWKLLKQNMDFLLLSSREPLKEICAKMSTLEDLDEIITKAYSEDRFARSMAIPMFQRTLEKKEHENLISLIMTAEEIRSFKNELQLNKN